MKELLSIWWRQRAPRERALIGWGGAALLLALAYAYVWLPVAGERHKLQAALPALRAAAAAVRMQAEEAGRLKAALAPPVSGAALLAAVRQAAGEGGNAPQLTLLDEKRVNLVWPAVSFDAWLNLLAALQAGPHVRLESATLAALPESGGVRVQAVLAAP